MRTILLWIFTILILASMNKTIATEQDEPWPSNIQLVLDNTQQLQFGRQNRLPIFLWPARNPGHLSESRATKLVRLLNKRGIGLICSWDPARVDASLLSALPVARAQKKLGLSIIHHIVVEFFLVHCSMDCFIIDQIAARWIDQ